MSDSISIVENAEKISADGVNQDQIKSKAKDLLKTGNLEKRLDAIPLAESEEKEISDLVNQTLDSLRKLDIYSEDDEQLKNIDSIFTSARQRRSEADEISNMFLERNYRGMENSTSFKSINEMQEVLEQYNPRKFDLKSPEKIFNFIPMPSFLQNKVQKYFRSFKTAETSINQIMQEVLSVRDDGIRNLTELGAIDKKLLKLTKSLKKQFEVHKRVADKVDEYLSELEERDPVKADKIRYEILYKVNSEILDTLTVLNNVILAQMEMGPLKKTQEMIIRGCERVTTTGRLILTINQTIAVAAHEQGKAIDMLDSVNNTINTTTEENAKTVKEHIQKAKEFAQNPLSAVDSMEKAFSDTFAALDELRNAEKELNSKVKGSIEKMQKINKVAEDRIMAEHAAIKAVANMRPSLDAATEVSPDYKSKPQI